MEAVLHRQVLPPFVIYYYQFLASVGLLLQRLCQLILIGQIQT